MKYNSGLFGVDSVYCRTARKTATEAGHALGKTNLSQTLIAFLRRNVLGRLTTSVPALILRGLSGNGGIVNNLVLDGLVGIAKRGVEDSKKTELSGHNGT